VLREKMPFKHDPPLIGIVGVCASGKSTLINELQHLGYSCRHIAQEHSYVPTMWQRLTNPDCLIYLSASYENTLSRRKLNWTPHEYQIQLDRLKHARELANIHIDTDQLSAPEVVQIAKDHIDRFLSTQN
jgi:deoxyadenosine/deoxycytidine kinase